MKLWKRCPLLILLLVSGLILEVIGFANRNGIYREYEGKTAVTPALASVFVAAKDGVYPWSEEEAEEVLADASGKEAEPGENREADLTQGTEAAENETAKNEAVKNEAAENKTVESEAAENEAAGNEAVENEAAENEAGENAADENAAEETPGQKEQPSAGDSDSDSAEIPEDAVFDFVQVEENYFDDALFIGDSRTQGMLEYGGLQEHATFYCKTSLTVYDLFKKNKAFIKEGDEKLTLTEALERHQFNKIYLMIGINEMGTGTAESFFEEYARTVFELQRLQPNAIIFVQSIMRVAGDKNATDPIFNNHNINVRNVEIQTLEDKKNIFYLEVNDAVCDENGNLIADWTYDQIHLKAKYYLVWKDYLLAHGIVRQ